MDIFEEESPMSPVASITENDAVTPIPVESAMEKGETPAENPDNETTDPTVIKQPEIKSDSVKPIVNRRKDHRAMSGMGMMLAQLRKENEMKPAVVPPLNAKEPEVVPFKKSRAATSGMGALLAQLRSESTKVTAQPVEPSVKPAVVPIEHEEKEWPKPSVVEYSLNILNEELKTAIPIQIISECFSEGTTPKFNFGSTGCTENNYVRSCHFSPDGSFLVADSEDRRIRCFEFKEGKANLKHTVLAGGLVYDIVWHPSGDCFASTSSGSPIHFYSTEGRQLASYTGINQFDQLEPAFSVAFNLNAKTIYGGYRGIVRRFSTDRPGRPISEFKTYEKGSYGSRAILSCIKVSPEMNGVFAVGCYGGHLGIYSDFTNSCDLCIPTAATSVSHLQYSPDGRRLYISGRKIPFIECFDVRNSKEAISRYDRAATTNQKFFFQTDFAEKFLFSGSSNGEIRVFDLKRAKECSEADWIIPGSCAATTGIALHPRETFVVTSHGQRIFPSPLEKLDDEDDKFVPDDIYTFRRNHFDNSLKIWKF